MPGAANAKAPRLSMWPTLRDAVLRTAPQGEVMLYVRPHPEEPRVARRLEGWQREGSNASRSRHAQPTQVGHGEIKRQQNGLRRAVGAVQMDRPVGRAREPLQAFLLGGEPRAIGFAHAFDPADRVLALGFEALELHMSAERQVLLWRV